MSAVFAIFIALLPIATNLRQTPGNRPKNQQATAKNVFNDG